MSNALQIPLSRLGVNFIPSSTDASLHQSAFERLYL